MQERLLGGIKDPVVHMETHANTPSGRGRGETVDGSLPTLTTNCARLWSVKQKRYLTSTEALASQCLATTPLHAKKCGSPHWKDMALYNKSHRVPPSKSGGIDMSMSKWVNLPCVGAVVLAAMCCLAHVR